MYLIFGGVWHDIATDVNSINLIFHLEFIASKVRFRVCFERSLHTYDVQITTNAP